jgi:hypothetical protein
VGGIRGVRTFALPAAAFVLPLAPLALWFAAHPQTYPDTFGRWAIHAAHIRFPLDGLQAFVNWTTLGTRVSLYWGFFDPSWLFFDAAPSSGSPLRGASPFLFATSILLVTGVSRGLRLALPAWTQTLLAGLAVAPLAASTFGQRHAIGDALAIVPFAVVIATGGLAHFFQRKGATARTLAWVVVVALLIDFARFYASYFAA